jgi:lysophospholipase L1-like esterase
VVRSLEEVAAMRRAVLPLSLVLLLALTLGGSGVLAGQSPPARLYADVLVVGDSISAGWFATTSARAYPAQLLRLLREADARAGRASQVLAVPGTRAVDGLEALRALPTVPRADLIVVEFGTNDYGHLPNPIGDFQRTYQALLALLSGASPQATVVCVSVWAPRAAPNPLGVSGARYDEVISQTCAALPRHPGRYVDISAIYADPAAHGPNGRPVWLGTGDEFHPNDAGHLAIAQAIYAVLAAPGG